MKSVLLEGTDPQELISAKGDKSTAVICISFCNFGDGDAFVDLFACESGKQPPTYDKDGNLTSGDESTWLLKKVKIEPGDAVIFNLEKLLLHPGDKLYARKYDGDMKVSVILSYEEY